MIDEKLALLRTHRSNIGRYRRLLKTHLTELERKYVERRLSEEKLAFESIARALNDRGVRNIARGTGFQPRP